MLYQEIRYMMRGTIHLSPALQLYETSDRAGDARRGTTEGTSVVGAAAVRRPPSRSKDK